MGVQASAQEDLAQHVVLTRAQIAEFRQAGIGYLHAQLLYNRGITTQEAMRRFLEARLEDLCDPLALIDMPQAVERLERALARGEHIVVFGDFDADGVTSAALLTRALRLLKRADAALGYHIPHRIHEDRGLSRAALDTLKGRGATLVVTTDCGSSDSEEVAYARSLGVDVIITDHHRPPAVLPAACAVVNPWRPDCACGDRSLCGVGLAFKLAQALLRARGREREAWDLLDLVAIGTIGDVAPLLGENHTLVRAGLQRVNHTKNAGLRALIEVANLRPGTIGERDIAYGLAPRINAAGRMDHAGIAYLLLTTDNDEEAQSLALQLEDLNRLRQSLTDELVKLAREQAEVQADAPFVLVGGDKRAWHEGVIGLVAGKLSEELGRPVFVLSKDGATARGSARARGLCDLVAALRARADLFARHGGHTHAAGFTIATAQIEDLREHLAAWFASPPASPGGQAPSGRESARMVDCVIARPEALTYAAYVVVSQLSPFGEGNPEPIFRMTRLRLERRWTSGRGGCHLRVRLLANGARFNGRYLYGGPYLEALTEGALVDVSCCLEPALYSPGGEGAPDLWLRILKVDLVAE